MLTAQKADHILEIPGLGEFVVTVSRIIHVKERFND